MVGGTDSFSYTGSANGTISSNNVSIMVNVAVGQYTSVEGAKTGWDLTSISCDDANSTGSTGTRTATFNVEAGETVTCTFTNTKLATIILVKNTVGDRKSVVYGDRLNVTSSSN